MPVDPPGPRIVFRDGERVDADSGRQVVVTGRWHEASGAGPEPASFARDASGGLWLVDRRPRAISSETLRVKGCSSSYHKGVTPQVFDIGYILPSGVSLVGRKAVTYDVHRVTLSRVDGQCYRGPPRV